MLYIVFLSLVSLFDSCVLLLWFVPLNFLFIVENMLSILFLFMYIFCRNIAGLFSLYCPFFALFLRGIWSNALSSSFYTFSYWFCVVCFVCYYVIWFIFFDYVLMRVLQIVYRISVHVMFDNIK